MSLWIFVLPQQRLGETLQISFLGYSLESLVSFLLSAVTDFPCGNASLKPQSVNGKASRRLHVSTQPPARSHGRMGAHAHTKLSSLTNEQAVNGCPPPAHNTYRLSHPAITLLCSLLLHEVKLFWRQYHSFQHGSGGPFLFHSVWGGRDQFSERRHYQGECADASSDGFKLF